MSVDSKKKKSALNVPGRKNFKTLSEYLKELEETMARLHNETLLKGTKGGR